MTDDAHMNSKAGAYAGLDRFDARKKIVEDLKSASFTGENSGAYGAAGVVRALQDDCGAAGFDAMVLQDATAGRAGDCGGGARRYTDHPGKLAGPVYFHWMRNIRDWPISRQLWWGHRIPAWYCRENGHVTVAREAPAACGTCGSKNLVQDEDVLDTWFSSGLWPFSTLGWPTDTKDLRRYYPTSVLITGHEILFFWVARMAMMGIHFTGKVPFRDVYLHNIVKNAEGQKMSKSKGTGIDPIDVNREYGTDAMRFTLA